VWNGAIRRPGPRRTGGRRMIQRAEGYVATIVSGEVTWENGAATGAMPGKLIRGGRQSAVAMAAE